MFVVMLLNVFTLEFILHIRPSVYWFLQLDALINFKSVQYPLACLVSLVIVNLVLSDSEYGCCKKYLSILANPERFQDLTDQDNSYNYQMLEHL